ncbi:Uncharacterised protein (plasmid) [Legionella adelaidensis]|uniref:Bacteriocin n=1 Tax=Legionella adelaidensis TaxID=45056 RepID=A0A0W0R1G1_9GAMM|nr:hypothetical protein [Legionella adelaidensis]KTC64811.1 hypothetical protein Lade_2105 [Legionella adelaidensis]VEH86199.1 Uncharacterised protein [Legionella adelaidensis]
MKDNKNRVMAYQLAKTLSSAEMQKIAGGAGICHRPSVQVSGNGALNSFDGIVDYSIDF